LQLEGMLFKMPSYAALDQGHILGHLYSLLGFTQCLLVTNTVVMPLEANEKPLECLSLK